MAEPRDERSLGELLGALTTQLGQLVHKEVELARAEITANALRAGRSASLIGVGGIVVHAGFLALVATMILVLMAVFDLDPAVAALLVAIVLFAVGGALISRGRSQLEVDDLAPTRTIETLKEDAEWARDLTR